jgi:Flp pilus assembly protein TadD
VLLEDGRLLDAAAQYRELLTRDSRLADAHNNLAIALARLGQTAEAVREAQIAVSLQPDNAEFRANLGKIAARANRP